MKPYLTPFFLGAASVAAASGVECYNGRVNIHFDEPVVLSSELYRGSCDKFDLTGDADHRPICQWVDQNRLSIEFAEGTSVFTKFRLAFKPGQDKYLSDAPMKQKEWSFFCPRTNLIPVKINGTPTAAFCIFPENLLTKEAQEFSANTPVSYEFLPCTKDEKDKGIIYGEPQAAVTEPATLGMIPAICRTRALEILEKNKVDWKTVNKDTVVPGIIIARAPQKQEADSLWALRITPTEESGFLKSDSHKAVFEGEHELGTGVCQYISRLSDKEKEAGIQRSMRIKIKFSSPMRKSDLPGIFRNIIIRANGQQAGEGASASVKTLCIDGKETVFTLLPPKERPERVPTVSRNSDSENIRYAPNDTIDEMHLEVSHAEPMELDIIIPAGTACANGLATACDHLHRLSLNPAAPEIGMGTALIPLKGDHSFLIPALNVESLELRAHHMSADSALQLNNKWEAIEEVNHHTRTMERLKYRLAATEKTHSLQPSESRETQLKSLRNMVKQTEKKFIASRLSLLPLMPKLKAFAPITITPEGTDAADLLNSRTISINLDTLTGGNTKPGIYLISMKQKVTPAVRRMLETLNLNAELFGVERFISVQVTDLRASADSGLFFLTRLSDGSPVEEGELTDKNGQKRPIRQGVCHTEDWYRYECLAQAGEDYTFTHAESAGRDSDSNLRMEIIADRPLYRPGDTVNLKGVLRDVSPDADCTIPSTVKMLTLTVRKPNGEILMQHDITPDEFGTWAHSFKLPEGEEDITGRYRINVKAPGEDSIQGGQTFVSCRVFRRDSFEAKAEMEVESILPEQFRIRINATDLNGTPLSRAAVQLNIDCSEPMLMPNEGNGAPVRELKLKLTTDERGMAVYSGKIKPSFAADSHGYARLSVRGSVSNDREEHLKLESVGKRFYAADFTPQVEGSRLLLQENGDKSLPLTREQSVHVRVSAKTVKEERLPGGIIISRREESCVWEQDVTVPANCKDGVSLPLADIIKRPELDGVRTLDIRITGTDAAGRRLAVLHHWYTWRAFHLDERDEERKARLAVSSSNGELRLNLQSARPGPVFLVVHSRKGSRPVILQTGGGEETHSIPLQEGENGTILCQLLQTVPEKDGLYTTWISRTESCTVPRPEMELCVALSLPEKAVRPGEEAELKGRISLPDGNAAHAAVTLFAVDAGMLSVAPYRLPDVGAALTYRNLPQLSFRRFERPSPLTDNLSAALLYPVWDGSIIGEGRLLPSVSVEGRGLGILAYAGAVVEDGGAFYAEAESDEEYEEMAAPTNGLCAAPAPMAMKAAPDSAQSAGTATPRLRTDFAPVAVWQASLRTDENGNFSTKAKLPDTLTSYRVFAVAVSRCGKRFGQAEGDFRVNQPVMITPGTPLFMSLGDCLRLPLTITNNTDKADTWQVSLEGATEPQSIVLQPGSTGTLFFDFTAATEGENRLRWTALAAAGGDAVEGCFPVRFPAPVLKESHHLIQASGAEPLKLAALPAAELAESERSSAQLELSANPLLHLASAMDFVLGYPYGCTEQTASGLLPWIFHSRLSPFSPSMQSVSPQEADKVIRQAIEKLFKRQQKDGGLGYWTDSKESCLWASAHAALVFTLAEENGISLPEKQMQELRHYLSSRSEEEWKKLSVYSRFAIGRACGLEDIITAALQEALAGKPQPGRDGWWQNRAETDIRFIAALRQKPTERHAAFLNWMRSRGHDYRHATTWTSGWMLVALGEYLRLEPAQTASATVQLQDGTQLTLGNGITRYTPPTAVKLRDLPTVITTTQGTAYLNVKFRALPNRTEYPGVTEKGLQVTRVYEIKDAEGNWKPATEFRVGDVVRVTLTCAKAAPELEYFVLEDYLPACMEAIDPNVPSQAAGLELQWRPWSRWFDHKEYLADRVRGFCTRWGGRDLLNMSYYARVKRAGTSTAPPAEAQLMYEPQTYGLSPNATVISK